MTVYRVDEANVRDTDTGEIIASLVGQLVQIVSRDTTTPFEIKDETDSIITDSLVTVTPVYTTPTFWIDVAAPSELYLDWLDPVTGKRGPVQFEAALRQAAQDARDAALAAQDAAEEAAAAAAAAAAPITGRLAVADTATLNLTMGGTGELGDPYEITGDVVGAAPETLPLGGLSDVDTTGASSGDALTFDGTTWEPVTPATPVATLDDLTDVNTAGEAAGKNLQYNGTAWVPVTPATPPATLNDLTDVDTAGAADGESLVYDGAGWVAEPARNPVTVSASAPSSPQLHDIWFDIS